MSTDWAAGLECTLPTEARPLRLAEFDRLFAERLQGVDRLTPTRARLLLEGPAGLAGRVRDLADRESRCCSFFGFTVTTDQVPSGAPGDRLGERVWLEVEVPESRAEVLAGLVARAEAGGQATRTRRRALAGTWATSQSTACRADQPCT